MAEMTGWDCHAHLFGPYDQFPLAADRSYTPPEAPDHAYQALLARLGLSHGVLVHPSAYGEDYSLLFHALAEHANLRGVIVAQADTPLDIAGLHARGVRAARFSHRSGAGGNFAGSASLADLTALAPRLAEAGLHAELWTDTLALPDIVDTLAGLPCPVVIDHMAMFDAHEGVRAPGMQTLLSLLAEGKVWVKLCAYRNLLGKDAQAGKPVHEAMVAANPDQVVWGTDWPHLRVQPEPDTAGLLALMRAWTPDEAMQRRILLENPRRLYL